MKAALNIVHFNQERLGFSRLGGVGRITIQQFHAVIHGGPLIGYSIWSFDIPQ